MSSLNENGKRFRPKTADCKNAELLTETVRTGGEASKDESLASITSTAAFLLEIGTLYAITDVLTHVKVCVCAFLSVGDKCAVTYKPGMNGGRNLEVKEIPKCAL